MIIWGSTSREIDQGGGTFHCPRCDCRESYRLKRVTRHFTLYFIPLFELEDLGNYVLCRGCGGQFQTGVLNYEPEQANQPAWKRGRKRNCSPVPQSRW